MPCLDRILLFYGISLALVPCVHGQAAQMFEWGFSDAQSVSTTLPSCRSLPLTADARTADGIPPFYMLAFAVGGTPSTSFIGTNQSNLTWTVTHPVGTKLVLGVVDSQGHSGGIAPPLYTVTAGSTTQCVSPTTSGTFKISANVTDVLNTCQPWGLTIEGGTRPYNVTIAALNSPNVTNVTLGPDDSVFTWINRMTPGTQLLASASDINGLWATGDPFVRTQGSSDIDCLGLVSTSSPGSATDNNPAPKAHSLSHAKIGIIVGSTVGGLLLCGIIIFAILRRRRAQRSQKRNIDIAPFFPGSHHDTSPSTFTSHGSRSTSKAGDRRTVEMEQSSHSGPSVVTHDTSPSIVISHGSQSTSKAGDRHTVETEQSSHSGPSLVTQPIVTELPPPYPNFLRYDS